MFIESNMDPPVNAAKASLENTVMHVHRFGGGTETIHYYFHLFVYEFSELELNTSYYKEIYELKGCLTVRKKRRIILLTIEAGKINEQIECRIFPSIETVSPYLNVRHVGGNVYEVKIPPCMLSDPNMMSVQITWDEKIHGDVVVYPLTGRRVYTEFVAEMSQNPLIPRQNEDDEMAESLMNALESELFVNFTIHVRDKKFFVHKALLAARSKFLHDYISRNCEGVERTDIRIDATYEAMTAVVGFLYGGEMEVKEVLDTLEVLGLAVTLNLPSLKRMCTNFLLENIDGSNMHAIKRTGINYEVEELVTAADAFIVNNENL